MFQLDGTPDSSDPSVLGSRPYLRCGENRFNHLAGTGIISVNVNVHPGYDLSFHVVIANPLGGSRGSPLRSLPSRGVVETVGTSCSIQGSRKLFDFYDDVKKVTKLALRQKASFAIHDQLQSILWPV